MPKTLGLSPKAVLAFLYPFVATLAGTVASWIVTGQLDSQELRVGLAGLVTSGLALLGAYVGQPGDVSAPPVGPASDDLLRSDPGVSEQLDRPS